MKSALLKFTEQYGIALRYHLTHARAPGILSARRLGHQAVACGLETLELARLHEHALASSPPSPQKTLRARARHFFAEVLGAVLAAEPAARQNLEATARLNDTLGQRTRELAASNAKLQRGLSQRESVEAALKQSGEQYARLLKESLALQESLRALTHELLAAQEEERKKISRELQDEIAQTLLGIQVRLLTLKKEARSNRRGLKNEIASTQRLVLDSVHSVRRFARALDHPLPV